MKYVSGSYTQGQLLRDINEIELALTERFSRNGVITDVAEQHSWRERVQDASFGRNTVMYDDQGNPSVMVIVPLFTEADVLTGGRNMPHPAFIVNAATKPLVYISKYQNFTTGAGATLRAVGLKHRDPGNSINFDDALTACRQKGTGWHLMTNAEWAAIALWSKRQSFHPRGNNLFGADVNVTSEKGIVSHYYDDAGTMRTGRTLTGSGPLPWTHDGTPFGIHDLNGNVWEWVGGMRINAGEIQVLSDNDAADNTKDQGAASAAWRAILQAGSLVAPGTASTLKYDFAGVPADNTAARVNTTVQANPSNFYSYNTLESLTASGGVAIPNILKLLGLFPVDASHGGDGLWLRNTGERLPVRGGTWNNGGDAGVFALNLNEARSIVTWIVGFRSAFVL